MLTETEMPKTKILLKSSDHEIVETSVKCVLMSQTIKEMLDAIGTSLDQPDLEIPVETIGAATLKRIVQWLEKHQDEPQPTADEIKNKLAETIDSWDDEFLKKIELYELYELVSASNFLNIPGLLWLATREIAYMIKGKTAEEVRTLFNIENDWTPEELEAVRRENQWCEEK